MALSFRYKKEKVEGTEIFRPKILITLINEERKIETLEYTTV
jgi:hypothetical protein